MLTCVFLALLFAFVYTTGFLGLGIICAAVLILFACLYGWLRLFSFARSKDRREPASPMTGEENVKRLKV